jgi:hypothetical protein
MTLFKTMKTRLFFRWWWSWCIFWFPTFQTEYHKKNESVLCNFSVGTENESYKGSEIALQFHFFAWTFDLTFWWDIEKKYPLYFDFHD